MLKSPITDTRIKTMNKFEKKVSNAFGGAEVSQFDSKQLFIVSGDLLVSYLTIIGLKVGDKWQVTTQKYSPTTSKQTTQFCNRRPSERIPEERLQELLKQRNNQI